jgi:NAD(P)H-hydrate epimerase
MEEKLKKIKKKFTPKPQSHKGQNGKVLIIGGSSLFHSASIWAAEIASYFVDIVHYSSTVENNKVFLSLKKKFHNGIIVSQKNIPDYVREDDVILIGPGMLRTPQEILNSKRQILNFSDLFKIKDEGEYTYYLTKYLIENFPEKKFVFDAGALQMMDKDWFFKLKNPAIITPHQKEFARLFEVSLENLKITDKEKLIEEKAKKYQVTILLKAIDDFISDGIKTEMVRGGNQGLTKGGTGDLLAGLTAAFYTKVSGFEAGLMASFLLKKSAEVLYSDFGYWYNIDRLVEIIPQTFSKI